MFAFEAIGTHWTIDIHDEITPEQRGDILYAIQKRIAIFDRNYSRFRADSLVSQMAKQAGTYQLPADAEPMMKLYERLYAITKGAFTPLIGQLLVDAGYDAEYSLVPKKLRTPPSWNETLDYHFPKLTLKQPALLDFGALGKGYLIDLIGELLETHGITLYTIDAGGDIRHRGPTATPLRVGLENPNQVKQVVGVATINNQSLCGSAGNRRAWAEFHHIMNPHTLSSPRHVLATWCVAPTTLLADAMATCLFFVPVNVLLKYYSFEYLVLYPNYSVEVSTHFPAELFILNAKTRPPTS